MQTFLWSLQRPSSIKVIFCLAISIASALLPAFSAEQVPTDIKLRPAPEMRNGLKFTLEVAINTALRNYPTVAEREAHAKATAAEITLVKTTYLPRIDLFAQELRGSVNNALGILFPPLSIPQVSGQADGRISFKSYWASNASAFSSWEVADFGLRHSQVMEARTNLRRSDALTALTKFQVASRAADAFFALVAGEEEVRANRAGVERMKVFATTVHSLVDADLKPGVDASRVDAELALAEDKLIQAEQLRDIRRANLAESMGMAGTNVESDPGNLMRLPPGTQVPPPLPIFEYHPLAMHQTAEIKTIQARYQVLKHEWRPHLFFESGIYGRGSGANFKHSISKLGYLPNIPNWAVGMKIQFHVMDIFAIKAKEQIVSNHESAQRAKYAEVMQILKGSDARAKAMIEGAQKLANNAPKLLKAAQETEMRSRARYNVGLVDINSIAESEKLLIQAEVSNNLAGLAIWRSYLAASEAHGDLNPLLRMINDASRNN